MGAISPDLTFPLIRTGRRRLVGLFALFLTVKGVSLDEDFFFFYLIKPVKGERFIIPGKGSHKNKRSAKRIIIYLTNI